MSTDPVVIFGAGGHAAVVADLMPPGSELLVLDESEVPDRATLLEWPISAPARPADVGSRAFHVAIGNNQAREAITAQILAVGGRPHTMIHAMASVAASANVGGGSFVAGMAVVGPRAELGEGVIVNHGAVVDHDCLVGAFCHIAPNATLGGSVTVGPLALVGAGAVVLPGVTIGEGATVGAGAVVTADVPPNQVWFGVPATKMESNCR